jgi:hypothetical protein
MSRKVEWLHLFGWGILPSGAMTWTMTGRWYFAVTVVVWCSLVTGLWCVCDWGLARVVRGLDPPESLR